MANEARYEILVPLTDYVGNPVPPMSDHAMAYIVQETNATRAHVEPNHRVYWRGQVEPFDSLVFTAEDKPENDSKAKQLAVYLAEVANQDVLLVTKQGKNGIQTWELHNKQFTSDQSSSGQESSSEPAPSSP